ncbi:MAG: MFS transporter [Pseudonocardia sp.]
MVVSAEFVVFLDIAVVNVALPTMAEELDLDQRLISLVVDVYLVVFGGLLLVGGRIADAAGRKRTFLVGFAIFTAASLLAGLAANGTVLVIARAVQGLGAALIVPATTALIIAMFDDPAQRARAFGIWGAMRAGGASLGAAIGGVVTQLLGWEWIFLVNVPLGIFVLAAGPRLLPDLPRDPAASPGLAGAVSVTLGLLLLSAVLAEGPVGGWFAPATLIMAGVAALALVLFVVTQRRTTRPLVPRRVLTRPVVASLATGSLYGAAHVPLFLLLSFYLQESLNLEALQAGLAMLPIGLSVMASSTWLVPRVMGSWGARTMLSVGLALLAVGLVMLALAPPQGTYWVHVLPAGLLAAIGLSFCFSGVTLPAIESVADRDTGAASGLVNSAQRIGSGMGVAAVLALPPFGSHPQSAGLLGAALAALIGFVCALTLLPGRRHDHKCGALTADADPVARR